MGSYPILGQSWPPTRKSYAKFFRVCSQSSALWQLRSYASCDLWKVSLAGCHHFTVRSSSRRTSGNSKQIYIKVGTNLIQGFWHLLCKYFYVFVPLCVYHTFAQCVFLCQCNTQCVFTCIHVFLSCPMRWVGEYLQLSGWENSNYSQLLLLRLQCKWFLMLM